MRRVVGQIDLPTAEEELEPWGFRVWGWAYGTKSPVSRVEVWLNGRLLGRAGLGRVRPDVARTLRIPAAELAGFELLVVIPAACRGGGRSCLQAAVTLLDGAVSWLRPVTIHMRAAAPPTPLTATLSSAGIVAGDDLGHGKRPHRVGSPGAIRVLWFARHLDQGGSQLRMAELIGHMGRVGGFTSTVLTVGDGPLRPRLEAAGATVQVVSPTPFSDHVRYEAAVAELRRRMSGQIDLVVGATVTSFPAVEAAVSIGIPSVLRIGESVPLRAVVKWLYGGLDPSVEERAHKTIASATVVWSNSHAAVRTYRQHGFTGHFAVVGAGVDVAAARNYTGKIDRETHRNQLGLGAHERLVVCAGSIWPIKGQALLAKALDVVHRRRPDLTCVALGDAVASYAQAIERFSADRGLGRSFRLLPFCEDLRPWWLAADAAVIPSESESLPAVVLEAMAFGLPVLGCRVGDIPELIVPGVTGWLCGASDVADLAAGLDELAAAPREALQAMGDAAIQKAAREHDRNECMDRTVELLRSAAAGRVPYWADNPQGLAPGA
jgi:glycosyltransferase involved in cell wall biosynthesis